MFGQTFNSKGPSGPETIFLTLADLPTPTQGTASNPIVQIAAYFRRLLESCLAPAPNKGSVPPPYLLVPSACALSGYFKCPEISIFEALQELGRQGYEYEIRGLDGPICLRDPKGRRHQNLNQWHSLSCAMLRPLTGAGINSRNSPGNAYNRHNGAK